MSAAELRNQVLSRSDADALRDALQSLLWYGTHGHTSLAERDEIGRAWQEVERLANGDNRRHRRLRFAAWKAYRYAMGRGRCPAKFFVVIKDFQDRLRADSPVSKKTCKPIGEGQPQAVTNERAEKFLADHPNATLNEVAKAAGASSGATGKSPAWKAAMERRNENRQVRARQLDESERGAKALAVGHKKLDQDRIDDPKEAWENIIEKATPSDRAVLLPMKVQVLEYMRENPSLDKTSEFIELLIEQQKDKRQERRARSR